MGDGGSLKRKPWIAKDCKKVNSASEGSSVGAIRLRLIRVKERDLEMVQRCSVDLDGLVAALHSIGGLNWRFEGRS